MKKTTRYIFSQCGKQVILVDFDDYDWLAPFCWNCRHGEPSKSYPRTGNGGYVKMHRLLMKPYGKQVVDHINGDIFDNRRCNLRLCTTTENSRNSNKKPGKNPYKGVVQQGPRFFAYISVDRKRIHLGGFATPEEAAQAYNEGAKKYFGEFARLNILGPQ